MMLLPLVARHAANGAQVQDVVNVILIIAAVVLGVIAAAKLCGAKILARAEWWQVALAALILFIIWWLW
jgi:hypothetical protein